MKKTTFSSLPVHSQFVQKTGSEHLQHQLACEDILCSIELSDFVFCGLADGQSGMPLCKEGATAALHHLGGWILRQGIQNLIHARFPDEIPFLLMKELRCTLLALAEATGNPLAHYASTFIAIAIDPQSGEYVLFHLGDGCALRVLHDDSVQMLSSPDNPLLGSQTWLTTSNNATSHLRFIHGSTVSQKRIVLLSDGTGLYRGKNILPRTRSLIANGSEQDFLDYWAVHPPVDDSSCILLDFPQ